MKKDYFCILAGGGVRGTAYVGVMKALRELNINISGLAGSSVGAIFAAFFALGYTPDEVKELLYKVNYQSFRDLYIPMKGDFGFFKGDEVYNWIKAIIEKKFYGSGREKNLPPVTFKDIGCDLVVVATDISYTKFKEFNRVKTPDVEIAHAVRCSISLPGFFKPVWENDRCLVDGDFINNFPLWLMESEIIKNTNSKILEFRLESSEKPRDIFNFVDYFSAILDTNYNIATQTLVQEFGRNDQFEIIKIDTGRVKVIDFGISNSEKEQMIKDGYSYAKKYLDYEMPAKKRNINQIYTRLKQEIYELKKNIIKTKIPESSVNIGKISVLFTENKSYIHKILYNNFLDLQKSYQNNLMPVKYLGVTLLREKKAFITKIDRILADIEELRK